MVILFWSSAWLSKSLTFRMSLTLSSAIFFVSSRRGRAVFTMNLLFKHFFVLCPISSRNYTCVYLSTVFFQSTYQRLYSQEMYDHELRKRLQNRGMLDVPPITGTTRMVLSRMLVNLENGNGSRVISDIQAQAKNQIKLSQGKVKRKLLSFRSLALIMFLLIIAGCLLLPSFFTNKEDGIDETKESKIKMRANEDPEFKFEDGSVINCTSEGSRLFCTTNVWSVVDKIKPL